MSSSGEIELLRADARDRQDEVALLRARLYRWGLEPSAKLHALERALERAEDALRDATARPGSTKPRTHTAERYLSSRDSRRSLSSLPSVWHVGQ
jgi:hypothetical protein